MHFHSLDSFQHHHNFLSPPARAERNTKLVLGLTFVTMIVEVAAGFALGSLALLADGWHMATHVAAFGITIFAYRYARQQAHNPRYTYGTGKVSVLGGFTSAVALAVVALIMALESVLRLMQPYMIQFNEAIAIAVLGLSINVLSAVLLQGSARHHHHGETHHHPPDSHHHHHHSHAETPSDHNLKAAYFHVLADALTSVLAIVALAAGKFLGWVWLDAVMGLVGAVVISLWAYGLVRETGIILLDGSADTQIKRDILNLIEADADNRVTDLHVWCLGPNHLAATIALVTHYPQSPDHYKKLLTALNLSHVVVEVNPCRGEPCLALAESGFSAAARQ
jgi:cation diffusion facilitator family transporter